MKYQPFTVVRLGNRHGPDKAGDWFSVRAAASQELVKNGDSPEYALLNGVGGSFGARGQAEKLAALLNAAWHAHYGTDKPSPCQRCSGTGTIERSAVGGGPFPTCPACSGTGRTH